ncbi:MAG: hypothetical protein JJE34_03475 [Alphaproteobacteria bacterium]|nr:hypothetical protein [Alphaproteobacteria bacterium]
MNVPASTGPQGAASFDFNGPTIVALLYLGGFITGISGLVGLVLAYVWKGENRPAWEISHYEFQIRTFWFGFAASIIGIVLMIVGIGFLILLAVCIWVVVRSVISLLKAQKKEAMPDPKSLLL